MFSLHSIYGRVFSGTLDQWRQVSRVTGTAAASRSRAVGPTAPRLTISDPAGEPLPDTAGGPPRGPLAAYAEAAQGPVQRRPLSRVDELMSTEAVTVPLAATLGQAWAIFNAHGIGQAPVVDDAGALVGLLLRVDLWPAAPPVEEAAGQEAWRAALARPVGEAMWTPVPSVSRDTDIRRAAVVLLETGLPGLPVVEEQGALAGFISRTDILRAVVADPPLELWA